ncbi:hypothetical protein IU449_21795 [Nocardia higoensis]|uniref:DUF2218 domain-containing protein n=1 Tax=Nocardia higoensis TaxID=228599 RepID=A0ABS0DF98_9NOCA|nr:hypothetical protein [Nocardia higoensis]MBF6357143.1 hypothetical protein [Nocardia higoensis]
MHVEQLRAAGSMTEGDAHDLAAVAGGHRSCRLTLSCHERSAHALVLPFCRDELAVTEGDLVSVTVEGPDQESERAALRAFAARFDGIRDDQPPKTRSTTAFARRVIRR